MQIVSLVYFIRDSLHEMSKPVFWEKIKIYFKMSSAEIFTQHFFFFFAVVVAKISSSLGLRYSLGNAIVC